MYPYLIWFSKSEYQLSGLRPLVGQLPVRYLDQAVKESVRPITTAPAAADTL